MDKPTSPRKIVRMSWFIIFLNDNFFHFGVVPLFGSPLWLCTGYKPTALASFDHFQCKTKDKNQYNLFSIIIPWYEIWIIFVRQAKERNKMWIRYLCVSFVLRRSLRFVSICDTSTAFFVGTCWTTISLCDCQSICSRAIFVSFHSNYFLWAS